MSRWEILSPMSVERSHCGAAAFGGMIYVFGGGGPGFKSLQSAERYDPASDKWQPVAPMPTLRSGLVASVLSDRIYAMGGGFRNPDGSFTFLTVVERFDPASSTWEKGPALNMRHDAPSAVTFRDEIYLFAGHHPDATGGPLSDPAFSASEKLDSRTKIWQMITPLPTPRFSSGAAVLRDRIWVVGGGAFREGRFQNFDLIEIYDPEEERWVEEPSLRLPWPSAGISVCSCRESVYIFGGNDGHRITDRAAAFDPSSGSWKNLPPMPEPRAAASTVVLNGVIYLIGGRDASGKSPTRTLLAFFPDA